MIPAIYCARIGGGGGPSGYLAVLSAVNPNDFTPYAFYRNATKWFATGGGAAGGFSTQAILRIADDTNLVETSASCSCAYYAEGIQSQSTQGMAPWVGRGCFYNDSDIAWPANGRVSATNYDGLYLKSANAAAPSIASAYTSTSNDGADMVASWPLASGARAFAVAGSYYGGSTARQQAAVSLYSSAGARSWTRRFDTGSKVDDLGLLCSMDSAGSVYLCYHAAGGPNKQITKLNSSGTKVFTIAAASWWAGIYAMTSDAAGNFYVAGIYNTTFTLSKHNPTTGAMVWAKLLTITTGVDVYNLFPLSDGNIAVVFRDSTRYIYTEVDVSTGNYIQAKTRRFTGPNGFNIVGFYATTTNVYLTLTLGSGKHLLANVPRDNNYGNGTYNLAGVSITLDNGSPTYWGDNGSFALSTATTETITTTALTDTARTPVAQQTYSYTVDRTTI